MAIYEYSCKACGHQFELLVRHDTKLVCPACEGTDLEKLSSLLSVRSTGTRDLAMRAAKKRDASQARDRMHDRIRYEESHDRHG